MLAVVAVKGKATGAGGEPYKAEFGKDLPEEGQAFSGNRGRQSPAAGHRNGPTPHRIRRGYPSAKGRQALEDPGRSEPSHLPAGPWGGLKLHRSWGPIERRSTRNRAS
jgi:hypothetical protein